MALRRFKFATCVLAAMLMLNPALGSMAWAHGGGGGGGGHGGGGGGFGGGGGHGGFGGGGFGGGGWGGGGYHGGGMGGGGLYGGHSGYSGGGMGGAHGMSGGVAGGGRAIGGSPGFSSRHFGGTGATGMTSAGRLATGGHNMQNMHNNWNHFNHNNNVFFGFGYPFFLFGFPFGYGYGGYGYGGYGYGGYGYGGYGYPAAYTTAQPTADQLASAADFTSQGEEAFTAGRYQEAVQKWQHALVDNPNNGGLMLLLSQGLYAIGQFEPAAGALQLALHMLPQSQWNTVVANYRELYPNIQNYTDQLRALEKARTDSPKNPALRFLLGYHYGYLGYPKNAIEELDKGIAEQPKDELAITLRNVFAKQAGVSEIPSVPEKAPPTPATQTTPPAAKNPAS